MALATLPWVEQDSITADVGTHLVTFAIKDKSKFNMEQVKEALKKQDFPEVELISGPDSPAPAKTEGAKPAKPKPSGDNLDAKLPSLIPSDSGKAKTQP